MRNEAPLDIEDLEDRLSTPTPGAVKAMQQLEGDVVVLGVGGKMGPTLARMAKRASDLAGVTRRVIGVSRFSTAALPERLARWGVEVHSCDLLEETEYRSLPDARNVVFMAGMKFGSTGQEPRTWAMNTFVPGLVSQRYKGSRIAAFSTGNVYGLCAVKLGGSVETDPLEPVGEYAMSCLGRERMFQHFSQAAGTPMTILRLNYATEMRYGVLVDVARRILDGKRVPLGMGHMNAIWQADANAMALESLLYAASPPLVLNIAGPELLSVRRLAVAFGERFRTPVTFEGEEADSAILSNAQEAFSRFGYPQTGVLQMVSWIADWLERGGESLGKPTHFEVRSGRF